MKVKHYKTIHKILNENYRRFHNSDFIDDDPICIPHQFSNKKDIEIAGFFAAIIAWGQRKTIIRNANKIMELMDHAPHDFILNHHEKDREKAINFVHRTFNADDLMFFFDALQQLYRHKNGLEHAFMQHCNNNMKTRLANFKTLFFERPHLKRTEKHIANPIKGSAAKRLNMFLRWMVRPADGGVDFGIWNKIPTKELMIPLDVHTSTVARNIGLLERKQNDWKAVEELTAKLRLFDADDPVKYDYALFGMGNSGSYQSLK